MIRLRKRSKFGNVKTTIGGNTFDSKREAARYSQLTLMVKAGRIRMLELQPKYPISVPRPDGSGAVKVATYIADFRYFTDSGRMVVEDVKGAKTPMYRLKKKLVEALYGIKILET
jgi:hypothetical protein